jgi:hypothetical protein
LFLGEKGGKKREREKERKTLRLGNRDLNLSKIIRIHAAPFFTPAINKEASLSSPHI